jgi:dipeptidyl aminopeptidase/acylaminoacyl peptidase
LFRGSRDEKLPHEESRDWWVTPLDSRAAVRTGVLKATRKENFGGPLHGYPWTVVPAAFAPAGDSLVFSARSGDGTDLWRIGISPETRQVGSRPQRLSSGPTLEESPSVASRTGGAVAAAFASLNQNVDIWSLPIDEQSGKVLGQPEPVTTPSPYSGHISISRDGRRLLYVQQAVSGNIESIYSDPSTEKVGGQRVAVTRGSTLDLSPDGKLLVFDTYGHQQEDIFVIGVNGKGLRQLTDDVHRDRCPRWSPHRKRIAFYSNRSGKYEIWTIAADGSGLQPLTASPSQSVSFPLWSPDGARLAYTERTVSFIMEPGKPWKEQSPQALPSGFIAWSWSPDGWKIAGNKPEAGPSTGIGIYSLDSRSVDWISDRGAWPVWLSDNRRLLFVDGDKISLVDIQSRKTREVFSVAPNSFVTLSVSRDDRRICFSVAVAEAGIWLINLQ